MSDQRISELLRRSPAPREREAEDRTWDVVRSAYERRQPVQRRASPRARLAVALVGAVALGALVLSPAGAQVREWIEDVVEPGREDAEPVLTSLPAAGDLLVESERGVWVVREDGSKRLLGDYRDATWSPSGLFVGATSDRQLAAIEPGDGDVRWTVPAPDPVGDPAWAPSGFRIAYLSGESLRLVAGDGTGDRLLVPRVAPVTPAWQPFAKSHLLAFVDRANRVRLLDLGLAGITTTAVKREVWRVAAGERPSQLTWSPGGTSLLVVTGNRLRTFDGQGTRVRGVRAASDAEIEDAAYSPDGRRIALTQIRHTLTGPRSEVLLVDPAAERPRRRPLLSEPGRFTELAWSPDGRWLLLAWRDADQWLFVRPSDRKVIAFDDISAQFAPGATGDTAFPRVAGWCCLP